MADINIGQIGINPGQFQGLAQLAGTRTGNLGLDLRGGEGNFGTGIAAGLNALGDRIAQSKQLKAAQAQSNLERQDRLAQQAQAQSNYEQDRGDQNAYRQQALEASKAQSEEEQKRYQQEFDLKLNKQAMELAEQQDKKRLETAAVAAFNMYQMDPQEWSDPKTRAKAIGSQVSAGVMSKDDAAEYSTMSFDEMRRHAKSIFMIANKASQYAALIKDNKSSNAGSVTITDPETGMVVYQKTSTPGTKATNDTQESAVNIAKGQKTLEQIEKSFDPKFLTTLGQWGASTAASAEKSQGMGVVPDVLKQFTTFLTGIDPKDQSQYIKDYTKFQNQVGQYFNIYRKEVTGSAAALAEIDRLEQTYLNGKMSSSEVMGSIEAIKAKYGTDTSVNAQVLEQGVPTSKTYTAADFQHTLDTHPGLTEDQLRKQLQDSGYTEAK